MKREFLFNYLVIYKLEKYMYMYLCIEKVKFKVLYDVL